MKKDILKKNKVLGINLLYILSILPVIIFGFYKNGIVVHNHGYISLFLSLQYLVIPIVIIVLSYVFEIYYYIGLKKDEDYHNVVNSLVPYINALCYLVCGPLDYLWLTIPLIIVLDIGLKFIDNKFTINQVALFKCILYLILMIMGIKSVANNYELTIEASNSFKNLFLGNYVGEIGVTSTLLVLVGYGILFFNSYYKKEIPIISLLCYAIVSVIIVLVLGTGFKTLLVDTVQSGLLFNLVFVGTISEATPVVKMGRIIYALLLGFLCAICINIFHLNILIYVVILGLSLFTNLFNKIK